jgi:hypothetical protein
MANHLAAHGIFLSGEFEGGEGGGKDCRLRRGKKVNGLGSNFEFNIVKTKGVFSLGATVYSPGRSKKKLFYKEK